MAEWKDNEVQTPPRCEADFYKVGAEGRSKGMPHRQPITNGARNGSTQSLIGVAYSLNHREGCGEPRRAR